MATITGTVSVNAAFLQEIKQENQRLREILAALRQLILKSVERNGHPRRLVELLDELCDQLALHFSLEESYGYFEDAIDAAPRMAERAESLRGEHVTLFDTIREIANDAEEAVRGQLPHVLEFIGERFCDFDAALERHESQENALVFEAFDDDIGVGD
jgi:hemerythrin